MIADSEYIKCCVATVINNLSSFPAPVTDATTYSLLGVVAQPFSLPLMDVDWRVNQRAIS